MTITPKDFLGAADSVEVRIMDLSGGNGSDPVEIVRGFTSLAHANSFARRRVRDSVEFCRMGGMTPGQVTEAWFAFGEDAVVAPQEGAPALDGAWSSATELHSFAEQPCTDGEERNWRILDPRKLGDDEDDDEEEADDSEAGA